MMPRLLKVCLGTFYNESRDYRECNSASEAGFDIKVLASVVSSPHESGNIETIKGFEVHRYYPLTILHPSRFPFSGKAKKDRNIFERLIRAIFWFFSLTLGRLVHLYGWSIKIRSFKADVISCHDIIALILGYLSTLFTHRNKRPKLVYDAHEFEMARNTRRSAFRKFVLRKTEKFLMKRSALSIMVNDIIADEVQKLHKLKTRPLVIRNIPPYWEIDEAMCKVRREEFAKALNTNTESFFVMYHGGIQNDRGIEMLIKAVAKNKAIYGIVMGFAFKDEYLNGLKSLAKELGAGERVLFHDAVPIEVLWQYVGAADVGLVLLKNVCLNHYYCLPNKFFENIQSLNPVIVSDFPELKRIVQKYDIGMICNENDVDEVNKCIEQLRTDKDLYTRFKSNLVSAKTELCWEIEKKALVEAYSSLR